MKSITLEQLLEAGCHFGHQITRQNPKARDYVFESRDNIHIIDLEKTKEGLDEAASYIKSLAQKPNSTMVILGAKKQAQEIVVKHAKRAKEEGADGVFYVTNRWIGGTFTNFEEVAKNFKRLDSIKKLLANEFERSKYTKKELLLMEREQKKLEVFYGGIAEMKSIPDCLFIVDTHREYLAVAESQNMSVKTVGITDTNADPTQIDYAIPANDDASGSIELIVSYITDAWIEGKKASHKAEEQAEKKEEAKKVSPKKTKKEESKKTDLDTEKSKDKKSETK